MCVSVCAWFVAKMGVHAHVCVGVHTVQQHVCVCVCFYGTHGCTICQHVCRYMKGKHCYMPKVISVQCFIPIFRDLLPDCSHSYTFKYNMCLTELQH